MFLKLVLMINILFYLQILSNGQHADKHRCVIEHEKGERIQDFLSIYARHLQRIVIEHHNIPIIWPGDLADLECNSVAVKQNKIEAISVNAFNSSMIETLDLSNNKIKCLFEDQLAIENLLHLSLQNNRLVYIEKNAIPSTVTTLNLRFNKLSSFESPSNVEELILSHNKLLTLDLSKSLLLKQLHLDYNELRRYDFSGLTQLTLLNLSFNGLQYLNRDKFLNMNQLFELDLSNNYLKDIDMLENTFPKLAVLKLNDNLISRFEDILQSIGTLMEPDVSGNIIEHFNFSNLGKVWRLKMNNMKLTSLDPESLFNMNTLYEIELSNNSLSTFNSNLYIPTIWRMDLSRNDIRRIDNNFGNFKALGSLDLSYNSISYFNVASNNLDKLWKLKLNNNKLGRIADRNVPNLNFLLMLDLAFNNLKTFMISPNKLKRLRLLDLSSNSISVYDEKLVNNLQGLRFYNLRNNFISEFPSSAFYSQNKLYYLDVSFNVITSMKYRDRENARSNIRTFNIFGNPLNCLHQRQIEAFCLRNNILLNICDVANGKSPICVDYKCDCEFIYNELTEQFLKFINKPKVGNCSFSVLAHNGA
ncbi:chaoptin-like isoform X2 [Diabrotica virgifera virgifera]|uniref:Uncharacterized protein n=1 Tax=Diabrotica virgifera virgifera TaxID=50390 RepID=A0ABM5IYV2_DIAVI|nr:chaoptin-like isoform X2 [Diabrotica virgifera virgifera]